MEIKFIEEPEEISSAEALQVLLPKVGGPFDESHFEACRKAAAETGASVCTAPFIKDGRVSMAYIAPEGVVFQNACFLPESLSAFPQGTDVEVFETPFGKTAMAAGLDCLQPQYARLAALKGCCLMICSLWLAGEDYLMAGPWSASQANCMGIAAAQPKGGTLVLPCMLTRDMSGMERSRFLASELEEAYRGFPVFDCMTPSFYESYEEVLLK